MKKIFITVIVACSVTSSVYLFAQQNNQTEAQNHPRIERAIQDMQDAIDYLKSAPHDFGGYKAQAIQDTQKAIQSLKLAMQYKANQDNKR